MSLGNSSFTGTNTSTPQTVDLAGTGSQWTSSSNPIFSSVAAGNGATCGTLAQNSSLICWGKSSDGISILGGGNSSSAPSFAYANDKLAVGVYHTCAIDDNGDVKCWGRDNAGQLGDGGSNTGTNAPPSTAIDLGTGRTAVAVSSGSQPAAPCGLLDDRQRR